MKITHQHFCWLYYTLFSLFIFYLSQNQGLKKKRDVCNCMQLIASNYNWLQLIAIETVCNWFKYKILQILKQIEFLFSWGIKSELHSFMFIYLSLAFCLYKYVYAHIFIYKLPFTLWWFYGNRCTWANGVSKCTRYHKTFMEGIWQCSFVRDCRGSNKMHQGENRGYSLNRRSFSYNN